MKECMLGPPVQDPNIAAPAKIANTANIAQKKAVVAEFVNK
jgi:hypothetical protein